MSGGEAKAAVLLALTALGAGVLRGFTGFGGALAMAPVFAVMLGPAASLGTVVAVNLLAAWQMLAPSWRLMERGVVLPMAAASVAATPIGLTTVLLVEPAAARRAVGLAVAAGGLLLLLGWRRRGEARLPGTLAVGAAGGVLNGLAGIGGPPAAAWLLAGGSGAARDRAGLVVYVALTQAATALAAALAGALDAAALLRAAWLAPLYVAGTWAGAALFRHAPERIFRAGAAGVVLTLGAIAVAL